MKQFNKYSAKREDLLVVLQMLADNVLIRDEEGNGYYRDSLAIAFMRDDYIIVQKSDDEYLGLRYMIKAPPKAFETKDNVVVEVGDSVFHPSYHPTAFVYDTGLQARIPMYGVVPLSECTSYKFEECKLCPVIMKCNQKHNEKVVKECQANPHRR